MKELEKFVWHYTDIDSYFEERHHWRTEDDPQPNMDLLVKTISLKSTLPTWVYDPQYNNPWGNGKNYISIIMDDESYLIYKEERYFHPIIAMIESNKLMSEIGNLLHELNWKRGLDQCEIFRILKN